MLIRYSGPRDWRLFFASDLKISLNGETMKDVIEADDEAGYIVSYVRDALDRLLIAPGGLRYETVRLEGTVVLAGTRRFSPDDAKAAAAAKRARRQQRNLRIAGAA